MNKHCKHALLLVLAAILLASCNKNSNELPPSPPVPLPAQTVPPPHQDTTTLTLRLDEKDPVLSARLIQKTDSTGDSIITISLSNLTGQEINNLVLLVKVVRGGGIENYDNVNLQKVVGPVTVSANTDTTLLLFRNEGIKLTDVTNAISVHIIHYKNGIQPYANTLSGIGSYASFIRCDTCDQSKNYSGLAKGYVQADGRALFLFKAGSSRYFTCKANFEAGNPKPAVELTEGTLLLPVELDSITVAGSKTLIDTVNNSLHIKMKLKQQLADSVDFIELYLNKN